MELTEKTNAIQEEEQFTSILTEVIPPSDEQCLVLLAKA